MGAYSLWGATGFYYGLTLGQLLCSTEESGGSSHFSAPHEVTKILCFCSLPCSPEWHVGVMGLALDPVVRLWTRALYREIMQATSLGRLFLLSEEAQNEVKFWMENFSNSGYPIWSPCPTIDVMTYSDASEIGWGGYAVQIGDLSATGCWSEADRKRSSTWGRSEELNWYYNHWWTAFRVRKCFTEQIIKILCTSCLWVAESRTCIKMRLTFISFVNRITFVYPWSGLVEMTMYEQTPYHEQRMQMIINWTQLHLISWTKCGVHTRWIVLPVTKLSYCLVFCSRFRNPGCESIDAFTVSWGNENNWIFPPPYLIPRVIQHMADSKEYGTIILPEWHSAPWWPLLITRKGTWQEFVKDSYKLEPYDGILIPGSAASTQFASGVPAYSIMAVRVGFSSVG